MKQSNRNIEPQNKVKDFIISIIYFILIIEIQINLLSNLIIISNFDSPFLFEYIYNWLIKIVVGG